MPTRDLNVRLGLDTAQFERGMNRAVRNLDRFARRVESTGRELTTRLTVPIVAVGAAALKSFADFEKLTKGLEAIATEADPAADQLERLRKLALNPGISLEQAVAGSIRLQAVGQSAQEAERTLLQFSKAVALAGGTAEDLDVVVRQLTQIQSKGRILSEDFLVIAERVPAIGLALETAFGTKNIEAIRETGISAEDFVTRLTEGIAQTKAFQNVTGGLANAFDNFRQSIVASLVVVGNAINDSIDLQGVLSRLADLVNNLAQRFANLDERTKRIVVVSGLLAAAIGPVLIALGGIVRILPILVTGMKAFGLTASIVTGVIGGVAFAFFELSEKLGGTDRALAFIEAKFVQLVAVAKEATAVIADEFRILGVSIQLALAGDFGAAAANLTLSAGDAVKRIREAGKEAFEGSIIESAFRIELPKARAAAGGGGGGAADLFAGVPDLGGLANAAAPLERTQEALGGVREKIAALGELPTLNLLNEEIQSVSASTEQLGEIQSAVGQQSQSFAERQRELLNVFDNFNVRLNNVVEGGLASFVEGFGEAIGALATGAANAGQVFASLTGIFAGILERLGKIAIETGIGLLAIQTAFKTLNPFVALAAGAALIAFSKIIRAQVKDVAAFAEGGLVFGPTLGLVGEGPGTTRSNPEVIAPLDKLRGMLDGGRGSGFVASTRLDGDDLLLIIERAEQRQNRIR